MHQGRVVPSPWKLRCESTSPRFMRDNVLLYSLTHNQTQSCEFRALARKPESHVLSPETLWPRTHREYTCASPLSAHALRSRESRSATP
jgi:hypothetical protein